MTPGPSHPLVAMPVLGLLLAGCPSIRPAVTSLEDLPSSAVAVVGRAVLAPPLTEAERSRIRQKGPTADAMRNHVWLTIGAAPLAGEVPDDVQGLLDGSIETPWNELFFSRFNTVPQYLQMASYYVDFEEHEAGDKGGQALQDYQRVCFRANLKLRLREGDRIVYVGTVHFDRTMNHLLTAVRVTDDYDADLPAIRRRLGGMVSVRKAIASP